MTWLIGAWSPCGMLPIAFGVKSKREAPRLGWIEPRASSSCVAVTLTPGRVTWEFGAEAFGAAVGVGAGGVVWARTGNGARPADNTTACRTQHCIRTSPELGKDVIM